MSSTSTDRMRRKRMLDREDPNRKNRKFDGLFMFGDTIEVAIVQDTDNQTWFRGVDIARALEMKDPTVAVAMYIEKKYTMPYESLSLNSDKHNIPGIHPKTTFVNETGMNAFLIRSRKPKAAEFNEWVCGQVLPTIRRTGKYEISNPELNPYRQLNDYLEQQNQDLKKRLTDTELRLMGAENKNEQQSQDLKKRLIEAENERKQQNQDLKKRLIEAEKERKHSTEAVYGLANQLFSLRPSCIVPLDDERKDEYLVIYRKFQDREDRTNYFRPYYACRVQKEKIAERRAQLMETYPDLEKLRSYRVPNAVNFFNYVCKEMVDIIERGKNINVQSFRLRNDEILSGESYMLQFMDNLYRYHYGNVDKPE